MNSYENGSEITKVNGINIHYSLEGQKNKPYLVLINMASHNLTCWEGLYEDFLDTFQVLRFDLRGTGKSGWDKDENFSFPQYADDLASLMDKLSISKAFVLGVAYGARTAAHFALRHLDRLDLLALFDVSLTPPVEQKEQRKLAKEARRLLKEAGKKEIDIKKYWRFYENRDAALQHHTAHEKDTDITEKLSMISKPTLVACGRQDMNLSEAKRISKILPVSKLEIMEMTGHGSPFFRPSLVVEIVKNFYITNKLKK
ncbi:MAG: 3-oxoadipate enol-lactone hydrolase [Gammaproteobacteria bacterium]|nr:3-oxoadipate enol-lactone hydrolase [Gammaproteobacteria bacterium]